MYAMCGSVLVDIFNWYALFEDIETMRSDLEKLRTWLAQVALEDIPRSGREPQLSGTDPAPDGGE